jgi:hypothetical protein
VFGVAFAFGLLRLWLEPPVAPPRLDGFRALCLFAALLGAAYLCVHLRASLRIGRFYALLAIWVVLAAAAALPAWHLFALAACGWAVASSGDRTLAELAAFALLFQGVTLSHIAPPAIALALGAAVMLCASRRRPGFQTVLAVVAACAAPLLFGLAAGGVRLLPSQAWLAAALACAAAPALAQAASPKRSVLAPASPVE